MTEKNGFYYSTLSWGGYTHRAVFNVKYINTKGYRYEKDIHVYTDNPNQGDVMRTFYESNIRKENVLALKMTKWATKEQDLEDGDIVDSVLN